MRDEPLTVNALPATIEILKNHLFNWSIWPDFTQIPTPDKPFLRYEPIEVGQAVSLGNGRKVTPLPANHVVPAVGYQLDSGKGSLVFTGDTTTNDPLWAIVNKIANLKQLIIECAFCNREKNLAIMSKHLCPSMLAEELAKLEAAARSSSRTSSRARSSSPWRSSRSTPANTAHACCRTTRSSSSARQWRRHPRTR
jgi:cAMP phosphodiesterase